MRKLIAVDIDGTLINGKRQISDKTKTSLIKAQEKGHIVVISTGRDFYGIIEYAEILQLEKYKGLVSNNNGCKITNYGTKEVIIEHTISIEESKKILDFTNKLKCSPILFKDGKILSRKNNKEMTFAKKLTKMELIIDENLRENLDFPPTNIAFSNLDSKILDKCSKLINNEFGEKYTFIRSTPYYCELMPKGINKGTSLIDIAKYYNIDLKDSIAFGDEANDLEMLEVAGIGIAMGNASKKLKEISDYITLSNDQDGISDYLEKFVL